LNSHIRYVVSHLDGYLAVVDPLLPRFAIAGNPFRQSFHQPTVNFTNQNESKEYKKLDRLRTFSTTKRSSLMAIVIGEIKTNLALLLCDAF